MKTRSRSRRAGGGLWWRSAGGTACMQRRACAKTAATGSPFSAGESGPLNTSCCGLRNPYAAVCCRCCCCGGDALTADDGVFSLSEGLASAGLLPILRTLRVNCMAGDDSSSSLLLIITSG